MTKSNENLIRALDPDVPEADWQWGDFNADGIVDSGDLNEIAQNWQLSIPVAASRKIVPEPNALSLLMGIMATLLSSPQKFSVLTLRITR